MKGSDCLVVQPRHHVLAVQPAQGRCLQKGWLWGQQMHKIGKISKAHKIGYLCVQMHLHGWEGLRDEENDRPCGSTVPRTRRVADTKQAAVFLKHDRKGLTREPPCAPVRYSR
ncbi:uncharacterized [Tachysurus ichikawai]